MATTTPNFGWTVPTSSDLVKNGATAIETLGDSIDASLVDLKGGTTGQVLKKATNTDMDFVWSADSAGMTNPMTTTGDTIYSSSGSTPARLGIGSTGQVLTVASGVPSWATPASGGAPASASDQVNTQQSTTSTSFTDLATAGPAVTLTTGTKALVIVDCVSLNTNNQVGSFMGCEVSGASSVSPSTNDAAQTFSGNEFATRTKAIRYSGLTAGSNTFTAKYKVEGNTGTFEKRNIFVMDLGS
jgi:hypothetical protein